VSSAGKTSANENDASPANREERLLRRMRSLQVREEDIEETFTHSGGRGGQNVNKTSTAVVLRHRPSGLQVRCEDERSQWRNRSLARELLLDKIEARRRQAVETERARVEKLRRQKRKIPRAIRARILADKGRQAVKKQFRRAPSHDD
jgi:peptide chain release factor